MTTTLDPLDVTPQPADAHVPARGRRLGSWVYRGLLLASVLLAAFATLVPWGLQRSGTHLVTIISGSMVPLFPVGSTIAIHDAPDAAALQPGTIITFRSLGNGKVITHRIVKVVDNPGAPGVYYQTKGDANRTADPDLAPAANVIGVADGVLPVWEQVAVWLQTPKGRLVAYGTLFLLVGFGELGSLLGGARRKVTA